VLGKAGTIVLFNSNLWHATEQNTFVQRRWPLTLTFTRPFMKPQSDYSRSFMDPLDEHEDPHLVQLPVLYGGVPSTLEPWYQPPGKRAYRAQQG